jgi:hypothetical protein
MTHPIETHEPIAHGPAATVPSRGLDLPAAVAISWSLAGGMLLGGAAVVALILTNQMSGHLLLMASATLFALGAVLGMVHGVILGIAGRPDGTTPRQAWSAMVHGLLYLVPALLLGWLIAGWVAAMPIALTGRHDGFLKNEAIRILLPPKLEPIGKGMRLLGMGEQVDDLEIGMNRTAEQAAPQAKQIFLNALKRMSFSDARQILTSHDTAATEYFRRTTSEDLTAAFTPIVHTAMERVGVVHEYNSVIKNAPGGAALANEFNLDNYVVEKTLDGIFIMLGEEEKKIRKDPAAQTTALLKEVFGGR